MGKPIDPHKVGGVAGIAAVVLTGASFFVIPAPPGTGASAAEVRDYIADHDTGAMLQVVLAGLVLPVFLLFVAGLRERLAEGEGDAWLARVSATAGAVFVTLVTVATACFYASAWTDTSLAASPEVFVVGWNLGYLVYQAAFPCAGLMLLGFGLGALRSGNQPKWLAIFGAVVGVLLVLGTIGIVSASSVGVTFPVYMLYLIWLLASSIVLLRSPAPSAASADA